MVFSTHIPLSRSQQKQGLKTPLQQLSQAKTSRKMATENQYEMIRGSYSFSIPRSAKRFLFLCFFEYPTSFKDFLDPTTMDPQSLNPIPFPITSLRLNYSTSPKPYLYGLLLTGAQSFEKAEESKAKISQQNFGWKETLETTLIQPPVQHRAKFKVKSCSSCESS